MTMLLETKCKNNVVLALNFCVLHRVSQLTTTYSPGTSYIQFIRYKTITNSQHHHLNNVLKCSVWFRFTLGAKIRFVDSWSRNF